MKVLGVCVSGGACMWTWNAAKSLDYRWSSQIPLRNQAVSYNYALSVVGVGD